ncbi:amidohydrolase family protein [Actinomadura sp. LD22]|uniref:Amidohydrolase family protein n=1 Tax=Actinomadura physcomitrii TaxID=2650748 RepID=A0A6I4ME30_9ACTN|nr:amidohydrolase family protein [Actinomadura physcomitrii]MWA02464.1 amidohydrolase family protein [Actinomadura physcomitrii]
MSGLLFRDAEIGGRVRAHVRVAGGRITEVGPDLAPARADEVVECRGGALLPGLWDHHVHLHALWARGRSVLCGPSQVEGRDALAAALRAAPPDENGWVRGVGYAESVAGDLDAARLDALRADVPVRIQHRSGALWMLNSAAVREAGLASGRHPGIERGAGGVPTGRLWRADDWLRTRVPAGPPADLGAVGAELARYGITGVTDATPDLAAGAIAAFERGALPQRVHLLGVPLDAPSPRRPGVTTGPYKIVLADSGLPSLDDLSGRIAGAHARGRAVAVHCVTREALLLLLAALGGTGVRDGDRVEHAALVPDETVGELARLGLRVVTQPGFIADRGDDYLRDVPAGEHGDLYRHRRLTDAGVPVALSSDAPYGPLDPWAVVRAAVHRRTRSGAVVAGGEAVPARAALRSYLTPPGDPGGRVRGVRPGAAADLVLLRVPLAEALRAPDAAAVRSTVIAGRLVAGPPPGAS